MIAVVKTAGATVANRGLQLVVQDASGILRDVYSASFQILDTSSAAFEVTPVQIYPETTGNKQAIDVVAQRLGVGRYAATWAPDTDLSYGRYVVRWFYRFAVSDPDIYFEQDFEVVASAYPGPFYTSVYELREAGFPISASDLALQRLIVQSSRFIEHYTGRRFYPEHKTITCSGTSGRVLLLGEAICAIESVNIDYTGGFSDLNREVGTYRVFNRHIRENLFSPDDRNDPKIELIHGWDYLGLYSGDGRYYRTFGAGSQNVQISGIFGYTEPDNSMVGTTPVLIRQACQLMCFKQQYLPGSQSREDVMRQQRLTSEYTRDQGYIWDKPDSIRAAPFLTHFGDPEIDAILYGFIRPPQLGSA